MQEIIKSAKIKYSYIEYSNTKVVEEQQIDSVKLIDGLESYDFEIISRDLSHDEVKEYYLGNIKERTEEINYDIEKIKQESAIDVVENIDKFESEVNTFSQKKDEKILKKEQEQYNIANIYSNSDNISKKKKKNRMIDDILSVLTVISLGIIYFYICYKFD